MQSARSARQAATRRWTRSTRSWSASRRSPWRRIARCAGRAMHALTSTSTDAVDAGAGGDAAPTAGASTLRRRRTRTPRAAGGAPMRGSAHEGAESSRGRGATRRNARLPRAVSRPRASASRLRRRPSSVLAPVDRPPCTLHRELVVIRPSSPRLCTTGARHGWPSLHRAPQRARRPRGTRRTQRRAWSVARSRVPTAWWSAWSTRQQPSTVRSRSSSRRITSSGLCAMCRIPCLYPMTLVHAGAMTGRETPRRGHP